METARAIYGQSNRQFLVASLSSSRVFHSVRRPNHLFAASSNWTMVPYWRRCCFHSLESGRPYFGSLLSSESYFWHQWYFPVMWMKKTIDIAAWYRIASWYSHELSDSCWSYWRFDFCRLQGWNKISISEDSYPYLCERVVVSTLIWECIYCSPATFNYFNDICPKQMLVFHRDRDVPFSIRHYFSGAISCWRKQILLDCRKWRDSSRGTTPQILWYNWLLAKSFLEPMPA